MEDTINMLKSNSYQGRGIMIGQTPDGENIVITYFIMGRSVNSRNRTFEKINDDVCIKFFKPDKVEDASLIFYKPQRTVNGHIIVTNGEQTDTIYDYILKNDAKAFENALSTWCYEPDMPHFTPRISGIIYPACDNILSNNSDCINTYRCDVDFAMSILKRKSQDCDECQREYFNYKFKRGEGKFIHTYLHDANPLPTFIGEPKDVEMISDQELYTNNIWESLNEENKISLAVTYVEIRTKKQNTIIKNKYIK